MRSHLTGTQTPVPKNLDLMRSARHHPAMVGADTDAAGQLSSGLSRFDRLSVAHGAAALALWPPNADRHVAINALIDGLAASRTLRSAKLTQGENVGTGTRIEARHWRRWLASRASSAVRSIEPAGLYDQPLCVEAALQGERCVLIAGDLEAPDLLYRVWLDALASVAGETPDVCISAASALLLNAARLSTLVALRAELGSYRWPFHGLSLKLRTPEDDEYDALRNALVIPRGSPGIDFHAIRELVCDEQAALWRPLMETGTGDLLLADPWRLMRAALVRACSIAAGSSRLKDILSAVGAAAMDVAAEAATDMDWTVNSRDDVSLVVMADVDCRVLLSVCVMPPTGDIESQAIGDDAGILTAFWERIAHQARDQDVQHTLVAIVGDGRNIAVEPSHRCLRGTDKTDPWPVDLADLRLMGDGLRRDPLALPCALERVPRPPWPEHCDLVDFVGAMRATEQPAHHGGCAQIDGTEYMHLRARLMAARHPVPAPDGSAYCEVSRWHQSADNTMFCTGSRDGVSLLVNILGRAVWVLSEDRTSTVHDLSGALCVMLAYWLARLCERNWPVLPPTSAARELLMRFDVRLEETEGPTLAVASRNQHARLIAGPGFVDALCRGDNSADRMLIAAVMSWAGDRPASAQRKLLDEVAPFGRGTLMIWPAPEVRSSPPRHLPPPLVHARDRLLVESTIADALLPNDRPQGFVVGKDAVQALRDIRDVLEALLSQRVVELAPSALLYLVALHERAVVQLDGEEMMLPARAALAEAAVGEPDDYLGAREAVDERNVALRALIERISAAPPDGRRALGLREGGLLRAAAELQIRVGNNHHASHLAQSRLLILLSREDGLVFSLTGPLQTAGGRAMEQLERSAPELMASAHEDWWAGEPRLEPHPVLDVPVDLDSDGWTAVSLAHEQEHQIDMEQLMRVMRTLSEIAEESPDAVAVSATDVLLERLIAMTKIDRTAVQAGMRLLTLGPSSTYDATQPEHRPWTHNRERSYLRRPLVMLPDGRLAWSRQHLLICGRYLMDLVAHGRLRGSDGLRREVGKFSQQIDKQFEAAVLSRTRAHGWQARLRVKSLAGVPLARDGAQPIGDIDVLAWCPRRRRVWLLDAKRLAPSMLPGAIERQAKVLHRYGVAHSERRAWVRANRSLLATELEEKDAQTWDVQAAMVLDKPLAGAHLAKLPIDVWTYDEIAERLI